jgi:hypothetical protein
MKIKKCELSGLLKDECISYYWIGFILADGSINKKGELTIALSKKDEDHLKKLQNFLNIETMHHRKSTNGYDYVSIRGMDSIVINEFCDKFKIGPGKTYNPADVSWIKEKDLMLSLIAGFIDGDGNIGNQTKRDSFQLRIKCHGSWLSVLKEFVEFIYRDEEFEPVIPKIISSGYAQLSITNTVVLKNLKRKVMALELPVMSRKWDVIDLDYIGKYEEAALIRKQVLQMLSEGKKNKEICQELNIKPSRVSNIKKRNQ